MSTSRMNHSSLLLFALISASLVLGAGCSGLSHKKEEAQQLKKAEWHYKMGAGYFQAKQVPLAIRELSLALEKNPKHAHAHYLMGYVRMGRREYNKAIFHFKAALDLRPKFHDARNALGATYLAMSRWKDAIKVTKPLLDEPLYTSQELAHNNLGWAYYNMRKYPRAANHFKMSIFLKPEFCLGYNNLGLAYTKMHRNSEAVTQFRTALKRCPSFAQPHFELGKLLQESDVNRARAHFQRCAEMEPYTRLGDRCRQYLGLR